MQHDRAASVVTTTDTQKRALLLHSSEEEERVLIAKLTVRQNPKKIDQSSGLADASAQCHEDIRQRVVWCTTAD